MELPPTGTTVRHEHTGLTGVIDRYTLNDDGTRWMAECATDIGTCRWFVDNVAPELPHDDHEESNGNHP